MPREEPSPKNVCTTSARQPTMIRKCVMPASRRPSTMWSRIGLPRTSIIGLGSSWVSSRIRVPLPAASSTALVTFAILLTDFLYKIPDALHRHLDLIDAGGKAGAHMAFAPRAESRAGDDSH